MTGHKQRRVTWGGITPHQGLSMSFFGSMQCSGQCSGYQRSYSSGHCLKNSAEQQSRSTEPDATHSSYERIELEPAHGSQLWKREQTSPAAHSSW